MSRCKGNRFQGTDIDLCSILSMTEMNVDALAGGGNVSASFLETAVWQDMLRFKTYHFSIPMIYISLRNSQCFSLLCLKAQSKARKLYILLILTEFKCLFNSPLPHALYLIWL